jgi:hypothetical protein
MKRLERGEVLIVVRENHRGFLVPEWNEVIQLFREEAEHRQKPLLGPPVARSVTLSDIERFCDEVKFDVARVNKYGELSRFAGIAAWRADVRAQVKEVVDV